MSRIPPTESSGSEDARRQFQREQKDRLADKLRSEKADNFARILDECGQEIWLKCTECNARKRGMTQCKKRWCPLCAPTLAARRVAQHERALSLMQWPLHITLTIRNTEDLTTAHLRDLLKTFRRLRQRKLWKQNVKGGWVSLEIVNTGKGFHPHLHIIADARWIALRTEEPRPNASRAHKERAYKAAAAELSNEWADLVGQKTASCKTRRCRDIELLREAMKYAVEPESLIESKGKASTVIRAMARTRLFRGFGTMYKRGKELEEPKKKCACEECKALSSYVPESVLDEREKREEWRRASRDLQRKKKGRR